MLIPTPEPSKKRTIIKQEIKKLTTQLATTEIGIISLGKYTFFKIFPLLITEKLDEAIVVVKKFHGSNATIRNTG